VARRLGATLFERKNRMDQIKEYLGDSVYAEVVNGMILLTVNNGEEDKDRIYLELETYKALIRFVESKFVRDI
jgi:hypothetical protein